MRLGVRLERASARGWGSLHSCPGMCAMNRIQSYVCDHPRLRSVDYDDTYHWTVSCPDCSHTGRMTQAEWRLRRKGLTPALSKLLVKDEGADSGRAVRVR